MRRATVAPSFKADLLLGFGVALGLSLIAAIPLGLILLATLAGAIVGRGTFAEVRDWLITAVAVCASYFLAAAVAAPIYSLCRPIRGRLWGAAITGAVMAPLIYSTFSVVGIVLWEPVGRLLFGDRGETRESFIAFARVAPIIFAAVGLFGGPFVWWRSSKAEKGAG